MKDLPPEAQERLLKAAVTYPVTTAFPIIFGLYTGLRLSEILSLKFEDLSLEANAFYVRTMKQKGKCLIRKIGISSELKPYLDLYMKFWTETHNPAFNPERKLFISKLRRPIKQRAIQTNFDLIAARAGLDNLEGISFHSLRHSFAMNMVEQGCRLEELQYLLGHTTLSATGIYLRPREERLAELFA